MFKKVSLGLKVCPAVLFATYTLYGVSTIKYLVPSAATLRLLRLLASGATSHRSFAGFREVFTFFCFFSYCKIIVLAVLSSLFCFRALLFILGFGLLFSQKRTPRYVRPYFHKQVSNLSPVWCQYSTFLYLSVCTPSLSAFMWNHIIAFLV